MVAVVAAFSCLVFPGFAETGDSRVAPKQKEPAVNKPPAYVTDDLATLSLRLNRSKFKAGQHIDVVLILRAGPKGVYMPDYFGDFMETCEHGFSAGILLKAKDIAADPKARGCATGQLHSGPGVDSAESQLHNFIYLKPGERRTWHTELATKAIPPGSYRVVGEYLCYAYMMQEVSRLPQVHSLMAMSRVEAEPVPVQIH